MRRLSHRRATESNYTHFEHDVVAREYSSFEFLLAPERVLLDELADSGALSAARVLDVGVGGGRTTAWLAGRCASYVGIDISSAMIRACRDRMSATGRHRPPLMLCDVRSLPFTDAAFDLVLFSFNGLDGVGDHEDRMGALREIRRTCAPGACFMFSSDNLCFAARRAEVGWAARELLRTLCTRQTVRLALRRPTRMLEHLGRPLRWRLQNGSARRLRGEDHALLVVDRYRHEMLTSEYRSPGERIRLPGYYVRPEAQRRELLDIGFGDVRIISPEGVDVTALAGSDVDEHWWLYYACHAGEPG